MVQKFIKFIKKSPHKRIFLEILKNIQKDNLGEYDIKQIKGKK